MANIKHHTNPWIPKPPHKEEITHEELVNEHPHTPPHMLKHDIPMLVPRYNEFYDTFRTRRGWRYAADAYANGTVTTVAGSTVNIDVDLNQTSQSPNWRLEQWPGGTLLYPVIRFFSMGPQTATFATQGEIDVVFTDDFGNPTPLGVVPNNAFFNNNNDTILPGPITDTGQTGIGTLSFTLNAGATVGTYSWQLAFAAAYLLPSIKGYDLERIGENVKDLGKHLYRDH